MFTLFYTVAGLCRLDVLRILRVPLGDPGSDEFTDPVYEAADRGRHVLHLSGLLDLHVVVAVRLGQQVLESSDSPVLEAGSRGCALETVQDREPGRVDGEHLGGCRGDGRAPDLRTAAQSREHGQHESRRRHGRSRRSRTLDTQTMPRPLASTRLYQQSGGGPNVARFCISFLPSSYSFLLLFPLFTFHYFPPRYLQFTRVFVVSLTLDIPVFGSTVDCSISFIKL